MEKLILVTIGPSSLNEEVITKLSDLGVYLFRINLSHTKIEDLEVIIKNIQKWSNIPICLDSEGAQIRNQEMISEFVEFKKDTKVKIHHSAVVGDSENISFAPNNVTKQFKDGDLIRVDFNAVSLKVTKDYDDYLMANVESPGYVRSNKATDIDSDVILNPITEKDEEAFKIGLKNGINNFSLSFTNTAEDVKKIRNIIGYDVNLISKIESIKGVLNLGEILPLVDQILIDRGDLSREVSIEKIPFIQRRIISFAKSKKVPVYVATNLLETMIISNSPTRAEVNDIASTLLMGADGLVLAAETAIGKHPIGSVNMAKSVIDQFYKWSPESSFIDIINN